MRARRSAWALTAALAASIAVAGADPAGAIVDGSTIADGDLSPGGRWGFLAQVAGSADVCTGSLVAPTWVLTAAHCVAGPMSVLVGSSTQPQPVTDTVVHPRFDLDGPNGPAFDVALLHLGAPSNAAPATLPTVGAALAPLGATVEIAGFGGTSQTSGVGVGTARSGTAEVVLSNSQLLLLQGAPSSTAGGDSGGPTVLDGVLVGVHSFGVPSDPSLPSGEMPVAPLVPWIRSVLDADRPPQVTSGELQTPIDTPIEFPVQITDEQPVSISAQVTFTPTGGAVTACASDTPPTTCVFTPTPGFEGVGSVAISVTDGTNTATGGWSIIVGDPTPPPPNERPVITSPRRLTTNPGQPVAFDLDFQDPDGTPLTLADASLTVGSGTVSCAGTTPPVVCTFTPSAGFAGSTFVRIAVTDGIDEAVRTISVTVVPGGLPPTVEDQTFAVDAGETFTVSFIAHDDLLGDLGAEHIVGSEDSLSPSIQLVGCDAVAVPVTCSYATEPGRAGHASLATTFSDGFSTATQRVEVSVLAGGAPPVITSPAEGDTFTVAELAQLSILIEAADPEGDDVGVRFLSSVVGTDCATRDARGRAVCAVEFPLGSAGRYPGVVSVEDAAGNTTTVNLVIDVTPFVGNLPPRAELVIESSDAPITGELITARLAVDDPEGAPATCRILWGDGASSDVAVAGAECVATHRYRAAGTMEITATATDADGETSEPVSALLDITHRRARLDGDVSWRASGGQYRLEVDASPRSGEVELRLPGGRRFTGHVRTMRVIGGNVAEVRGTGRFAGQTVEFVLIVTDGGRGRQAVDTASIALTDAAGNVLVALDSPAVNGLTIR